LRVAAPAAAPTEPATRARHPLRKMHPINIVFEVAEGELYELQELLTHRPPFLETREDVAAYEAVSWEVLFP
jgi:hypothetical protein